MVIIIDYVNDCAHGYDFHLNNIFYAVILYLIKFCLISYFNYDWFHVTN